MSLPSNTELGALEVEEVFGFYDKPQIFSCRSSSGKSFLALLSVDTARMEAWILVEVSGKRLEQARTGRITLHDAFVRAENKKVWRLSVSPSDPGSAEAREIDVSRIDDDELPASHVRLNLPPRSDVSNANETQLWQRLAQVTLEADKSTHVPPELVANQSLQHVIDIELSREDAPDRSDVAISALGPALARMQSLMDALGQARMDQPTSRGKIPAYVREKTRLVATEAFRGSFGLRIETETGDLAAARDLSSIFKDFVELVASGTDTDRIHEVISQVGTRSAAHYRAFAKILLRSRLNASFSVGIPQESIPRSARIDSKELPEIIEILERESEKLAETIVRKGRLVGADLARKNFHFESEGIEFLGQIAEECLPYVDHQKIGGSFEAAIKVVVEIVESTGEEKELQTLTSLKPLD